MRTTSKPTDTPPPTETQMRSALEGYVNCHLALERITNQAALNIEKLKARADEQSKPHADEKALHEAVLERYAEAHPELFEKRQKHEVYGGHKIGWHITPPAVALIRPTGEKRKQTWEGFMEACRRIGRHIFIRSVEEPDKAEVLATHSMLKKLEEEKPSGKLAEFERELGSIGVQVRQEERFVIDLNLQPQTEEVRS